MATRTIQRVSPRTLPPMYHKVVIYCRISTHSQEQLNSMANQISGLTQLVASKPQWRLVDTYIDFHSGANLNGRPEFQRMLNDAVQKKFEVVVCKSISRFGRDIIDTLQSIRTLLAYGVNVIFVQEGLDSANREHELMISLIGAIAEEENQNRRNNINWGIQRQLESGKSDLYTRPCYGYTKGIDGELEINERQAETVRLIFDLYMKGLSVIGIVAELEKRHIPSPSGKEKWPKRSIEVMLRNKKYIGDVPIVKKYTDADVRDADQNYRIYLAVESHPPILSKEIFEAVQKERKNRSNICEDENGVRRKNTKYSSKKQKTTNH